MVTMKLKDKPAFPVDIAEVGIEGEILDLKSKGGMTLREYYTGLAMQGMLTDSQTWGKAIQQVKGGAENVEKDFAALARQIADALIAELEKSGGENETK